MLQHQLLKRLFFLHQIASDFSQKLIKYICLGLESITRFYCVGLIYMCTLMQIPNYCVCVCVCVTGDQNQGLMLCRQALYYLSHTLSPFVFSLSFRQGLLLNFPLDGLKLWSSYHCLQSSLGCRHKPPCWSLHFLDEHRFMMLELS